jgi:cephalosporin hydroxylase
MNYEDKVYKKSSLEHNDSISTYNGWGAQQNPNVFETFHYFLNDVKPKRILEIGTSIGGFTSFLNYTCKNLNLNCHILSYDIMSHPWYVDMISEGIDVRVENVFNTQYTEVKEEVIDFIRQDGTTIILCDGGSKVHEFNLLSNYMKEGDFIMAHDYSENSEVFERDVYMKLWNWHEISDKDIQDACDKNNLLSYDKESFDKVVWVCKKKN